jgi:hypothetical protein
MEKEIEMNARNSVAAIYDTHEQAEHAVKELQEAGVDMKSLSIVGRDTHTDEHVVGYYTAGDRMMYWGKVGAFWGGFWGLLFGSGLFFIPGLGPILAAGPIVAWIVAGVEGAVVVGGVMGYRGEGGGRRHITFSELRSERQVQAPPGSSLFSLCGNLRNQRNPQIQPQAHLPAR